MGRTHRQEPQSFDDEDFEDFLDECDSDHDLDQVEDAYLDSYWESQFEL